MGCVTADLVDDFGPSVASCATQFRHFGAVRSFCGPVRTIQTLEDNAQIKALLCCAGDGSVLVVDGGGSLWAALAGDLLAGMAVQNGWAGLILFGAVRDSVALSHLQLGIMALGTNPMKSRKLSTGYVDVPVSFGGITFCPGDWVYADEDGILVSTTQLPI